MATTGVGSIHNIAFEALDGLHEWDVSWEEHKRECPKCGNDQADECLDAPDSSDVVYYSDAPFVETPAGIDNPGATIIVKVNGDHATFQVILSPVVEKHGKYSPCYPNQADLDAEGEIECYALPDEFRA